MIGINRAYFWIQHTTAYTKLPKKIWEGEKNIKTQNNVIISSLMFFAGMYYWSIVLWMNELGIMLVKDRSQRLTTAMALDWIPVGHFRLYFLRKTSPFVFISTKIIIFNSSKTESIRQIQILYSNRISSLDAILLMIIFNLVIVDLVERRALKTNYGTCYEIMELFP